MKSRVSCCNAALLRRNLTRSALIWGAYLILWFMVLPVNILSDNWRDTMEFRQLVIGAAESCHVVNFFYGAAVAWFMFAYLNKSRSANFFAALPVRRETRFLTNYLSGLLCGLAPQFLIMGLTILSCFLQEANVITAAAIWFGAQAASYLFYYSFAVLCAMAVGQIVAMPILYGILNFVVVVVESVVRIIGEALLYGVTFGSDFLFSRLSPFYYYAFEGNGPRCRTVWEGDIQTGVSFVKWEHLPVLAAVGVVFVLLAFLLYRRRPVEAAGDVMAFPFLKPVFRWCFSVGFAIVMGTVLAELVVFDMSSSYFAAISLCMLIASAMGSFLGEMILTKSLRVFGKKSLLRCGITCAAVLALLVCCRADLLGLVHYVPRSEEVSGVIFDNAYYPVEDPQIILRTIDLHEDILDRQQETEQTLRKDHVWSPTESFTYVLKNGREVTRAYALPVTETTALDPNSLIRRIENLQNTPDVVISREIPENFTALQIDNCQIYYLIDEEQGIQDVIDPPATVAKDLWINAIYADMKAGNMGKTYHTANYTQEAQPYTEVNIEFSVTEPDSRNNNGRSYYYYSVPVTAVNTIRALQELGVPADAFAPTAYYK